MGLALRAAGTHASQKLTFRPGAHVRTYLVRQLLYMATAIYGSRYVLISSGNCYIYMAATIRQLRSLNTCEQ